MESAHELIAALTASTRDVEKEAPTAKQDCYDRLKIALFFDGTGNNRDADATAKKWSNIARLFDASRLEPKHGIYTYYISGVGTKLNRTEPWWQLSKYMRDSSAIGGGTGAGADSRLESGDLDMNDLLQHALKIASDKAGKDVKAIYDKNQSQGFSDLNKALSGHRLIKSIEVSVFGFSRGAALARAFVNRLLKLCSRDAGVLTYQSYPITFRFLGIFDTVASFGRPAHNDFADVDLWLPEDLQRCVHYVAAHELRYSFPLDLIRQDGSYPGNWTEEVFPGVHSDVGGGYAPDEQGRSDTLARVPLVEMFREAARGGVRLHDWAFVMKSRDLSEKLRIPDDTQEAFDTYMATVGSAATSGSVEQRIEAHMKAWYAYKHAVSGQESSADARYQQESKAYQAQIDELNAQISVITRKRGLTAAESERAQALAQQRDAVQAKLDTLKEGVSQVDSGEVKIADEAAALRDKRDQGESLVLGKVGAGGHYLFESTAQPWMLDAYYGTAPKADVISFFDTFVHDSKAGFLGGKEPYSYFRRRGVWESAHAVAAQSSEWELQRQQVQQTVNMQGMAGMFNGAP